MRSQYVPVVSVLNRNGVFKQADWLNTSYLYKLSSLQIKQQYVLQAQDVPYPELLSFRQYGTTDYWWILCMYNGVIDIVNDMQPGQLWMIPSYASIQTLLGNSAVGSSSTNQVGQVITL